MSNSVAPAVKTANDEIPWNPKVRQKKQPADYVVDFLKGEPRYQACLQKLKAEKERA